MTKALDAAAYVYQGAWTDWSKGASRGLTVTLSQQNSAILVAALALFVSAVGSQLWTILRFALHQFRADSVRKPGLYHQQQALLRYSGTSLGFLYSVSLVHIGWRKRIRNSFWSFLTLSIWALAHLAAITALGLLSSKFVKVGDKVLIRSPLCIVHSALPGYDDSLNQSQLVAVQALRANDLQVAVEYTRICYNTTSPPRGLCGTYPMPNIKFNSTSNVACPFVEKVCHPETRAIRYDTGLMDSMLDLGVNSKPQDRVYARKITTCIPLNDAVYVSERPGPNQLNVSYASYGPETDQYRYNTTNPSYSHVDVKSEMTAPQLTNLRLYDFAQVVAYQPRGATSGTGVGIFQPIPELQGVARDLSLVFMTYAGFYLTPIEDPWFSAHEPLELVSRTPSANQTVEIFGKDTPISTMACTEQYQVCATNTSTCTDIKGLYEVLDETFDWPVSKNQFLSLQWIFHALDVASLSNVILQNGGNVPFLANDVVFGPYSPTLPGDQWRRETENWFSIGLAMLQRSMQHLATGQALTDAQWINTTTTPTEREFCNNVVIRGTDYQSFSLLLIIIFLIVGLSMVVLSFYIESLTGRIQQRFSRGLARKEMWETNDLLQLQRMLYESHGEGTWSGKGGSVPVTRAGELLPASKTHLNNHDPKRSPKLNYSSPAYMLNPLASGEKSTVDARTSLVSTGQALDESDRFQFVSGQQDSAASRRVKRKPLPPDSVVQDWIYQPML